MSKPEFKKQLRQYADDYNDDDEVVKPDWQIEADYKAELEHKKSLRIFEFKREKCKHELELERVKSASLELEQEKSLREFELRERKYESAERTAREQREHEFKLAREKCESEREKFIENNKQREFELKKIERKIFSDNAFKVKNAIKFLNKFYEQDVKLFFKTFEQIANNNKWPKANWPTLVHAQFVGKAAKAISLLSNDEANDYDTVKNSLLKAYERVPQYYNEKFRTFVKLANDFYTVLSEFIYIV